MIANPALEAFRYNPYDKSLTREHYETQKMLQLRRWVRDEEGWDGLFNMCTCACTHVLLGSTPWSDRSIHNETRQRGGGGRAARAAVGGHPRHAGAAGGMKEWPRQRTPWTSRLVTKCERQTKKTGQPRHFEARALAPRGQGPGARGAAPVGDHAAEGEWLHFVRACTRTEKTVQPTGPDERHRGDDQIQY